jgi:thioredoxin-related protein
MKKFIVIILFVLCKSLAYSQTEDETQKPLTWQSDVNAAYELSKATNKPIFAFFTGSDWCGWCHKLQREVLSKPEFEKWATENVVLLELDFPRRKQLSPELVSQNQSLQQFFNVTGFPTIWMFYITKDEENKRFVISGLGSLGYPQNAETGHEEIKFLQDANRVLNNKPKVNP